MMNIKTNLSVAVMIALLSACSDPTDYDFENSVGVAQGVAQATAEQLAQLQALGPAPESKFDPAAGEIPFPNSLLISPEDGTLNIPLDEGVSAEDFGNPTVALNTLDGFSTTEPITTQFGADIDPASVRLGDTVRAYKVTTVDGAVTAIERELTSDEMTTAVIGDTVAFVPRLPLAESSDYMFLATNAVVGTNGRPTETNSTFDLLKGSVPLLSGGVEELRPLEALEPLRLATNAMLQAAATQQIDADTVVQVWTMRTQSITPVMQAIVSASQITTPVQMAPTGQNTSNVNPNLAGVADVYIGTIDVPFYLTAPTGPNDAAGISSFWRGEGGSILTAFNPNPVATGTQTIPVLMTLPNANSGQAQPEAGWPVAIFIHGVTANRSNMLAIADSMAAAGFAVIAIDQVMHGITATDPAQDPLAAIAAVNTPFPNDVERTFGIDLTNNQTSAPGPDGVADGSGTHYYSPAQLLTTRDNLRQSVADLLVLSANLGNIPDVSVDTSKKALIGHSLGGSTATVFAALDDSITSITLGMPAAGLVRTTIASQVFGPPIIAGLSAAGLEQGTPEFSQFVTAAQTVVDSAEPINFAAAAATRPVHLIEVVGDGTDANPADIVVLNTIPGAALAGTEAFTTVMRLPSVTADTGGSGIVRFTQGNHSSLLDPTASFAATAEMQTQLATFAATMGTQISVTDSSVILTTAP